MAKKADHRTEATPTKDKSKGKPSNLSRSVEWAAAPASHDYPSAASFFALVADAGPVDRCTAPLSHAPTVQQHAKDILRAARLPLLGIDDPEVAKDLAKVNAGESMSPILLIRGDLSTARPLQVVDGYHRVCASYHLNEDTDIPCQLISLPATAV